MYCSTRLEAVADQELKASPDFGNISRFEVFCVRAQSPQKGTKAYALASHAILVLDPNKAHGVGRHSKIVTSCQVPADM